MTYYGYKRGDNDKVVDFSSVTTELPKRLAEIEESRAKERESIEAGIVIANEKMGDVPVGNDVSMNEWALGASQMSAQALHTQTTLMRNGSIKPAQFAQFKQNAVDGMKGIKKVASQFNTLMDKAVNRQQEGKGGALEAEALSKLQSMADFSKMAIFLNEKTGKMMQAPKDKDGKPIMGEAVSISQMENMVMQEYNKFDVDGTAAAIAKQYGKDIQVIKKDGVLTRETYMQIDGAMETAMGQYDDEQMYSVLQDYAQKGLKTTRDPKVRDANPDEYVLMGQNGAMGNRLSPDLTDTQRDEARDIIKKQLLSKLDIKETPMAERAPKSDTESAAAIKKKEGLIAAKENINRLREFYEGDAAKRKEVMTTSSKALKEMYKGFTSVEVIGDEILIHYEDKDQNELTETVIIPDNFEDFVKTAGPKVTQQDNLIDLMVESGANISGATKGSGDTSYAIEREVWKGQTLADYPTVIATLPQLDSSYNMSASGVPFTDNIRDDAKEVVKSFIDGSGIKGADYKVSQNILTISVKDLGSVNVDLTGSTKAEVKIIKENLSKALKEVHEAVSQGKELSATEESDNADPLGLGI